MHASHLRTLLAAIRLPTILSPRPSPVPGASALWRRPSPAKRSAISGNFAHCQLQFPVISRNFAPSPPVISRNFPKCRLPNITGNYAKLREITRFQPRIITRNPKHTMNLQTRPRRCPETPTNSAQPEACHVEPSPAAGLPRWPIPIVPPNPKSKFKNQKSPQGCAKLGKAKKFFLQPRCSQNWTRAPASYRG
jgi:hypothetical protein